MRSKRTYRFLVGVFALLVVTLQTAALSHATAYADGPHEHNGVICTLGAFVHEDIAVLPDSPVQFEPIPAGTREFEPAFESAPILTYSSRAPPPRGPPAFS